MEFTTIFIFLNLLKDELKVYSFENLEKKSHTHYEFNIYRVNNDFNLYLIYIYEMNKEIFIVDTKGELYENLLTFSKKSKNQILHSTNPFVKGF